MTTSHTGTPPTTPDLIYGFSVVVPAYNEGLAVGDVVRRIIETMTSTGQPFEVIVVDDGSSDETAVGAASGGAMVISHPQNAGYGAALKTGITRARFDHILQLIFFGLTF